ncbi:MAG: hypothetical protein HY741_18430 [Chloroflexi bacterium]|nr:hypothetical protein [Chloroflexota bacterium]
MTQETILSFTPMSIVHFGGLIFLTLSLRSLVSFSRGIFIDSYRALGMLFRWSLRLNAAENPPAPFSHFLTRP